MLEMLLDKKLLFVLMGMLTGLGVADKCIVSMTMKRMIEAAGSMSKSNHPLMRLVRAKFEHACMISDTVENVGVFVDKYLYEYKVCGLRLHSLRRLEKMCSGLLIVTGLAGAGITCQVYGMGDEALRMGAAGCGLGILVWLFHLTTDENYCMEMAKNYMVDYLENVCLRKYEKMNQKECAGRVNMVNGSAEDEAQKAAVQAAEDRTAEAKYAEDRTAEDKYAEDEYAEDRMTEAGAEETFVRASDHSVVRMQRENRRKERNKGTARNLAKASARLAGADGSKSPEETGPKEISDTVIQNAATQNAAIQNAAIQNTATQNIAMQNAAIQNTKIQNKDTDEETSEELPKDEMIRQILREFMA